MVSLLLKNWRFILDALLIVALVVLIFLWNPFGIFGGGLKLGKTSNMVTEVREIGQLVTAEYYGEVIASIDESRLELIYEDSLNEQASLMYTDLKYALYNLYQFQQIPRDERIKAYKEQIDISGKMDNWRRVFRQDVDRKNILEKLKYHNDGLTDSELYEKVLEYLWREAYGKDKKASWNPSERQQEQVLLSLYQDIILNNTKLQSQPQEWHAYLDEGFAFTHDFSAFYYADKTSELPRVEQKKKLAMVGRGWVKAGFDFGTLDEHSFYFHEESSELYLFGFEPQILNADINPWFIPEKGIPGFEIIDYNGRVNFKDAKKVKAYCIQKLVLYAHRADIIMNAQKQGEETLKSFFSLLTGQEIKKIHFHNDELVRTANEIARDEFVNDSEATLLDSLIRQELGLIDSLDKSRLNHTNNIELVHLKQNLLKTTIGRLRKLPFEDTEQSFSYYSPIAFRMARDEIIDQHEQEELKHIRWDSIQVNTTKIDSLTLKLWYEDSLSFMMEYNAALSYLIKHCKWLGDTTESVLSEAEYLAWRNQADSTYLILDTHFFEGPIEEPIAGLVENPVGEPVGDSLRQVQLSLLKKDSVGLDQFLSGLLYPFQYDKEVYTHYMKQKGLFSSNASSDIPSHAQDSILWVYNPDLDSTYAIHMRPEDMINRHLLHIAYHSDSLIRMGSLIFLLPADADVTENMAALQKANNLLNERQAKEMLAYYQWFQKDYDTFRNKGAIIRASEWVNNKLADRKSLSFSFAEVKQYLKE